MRDVVSGRMCEALDTPGFKPVHSVRVDGDVLGLTPAGLVQIVEVSVWVGSDVMGDGQWYSCCGDKLMDRLSSCNANDGIMNCWMIEYKGISLDVDETRTLSSVFYDGTCKGKYLY